MEKYCLKPGYSFVDSERSSSNYKTSMFVCLYVYCLSVDISEIFKNSGFFWSVSQNLTHLKEKGSATPFLNKRLSNIGIRVSQGLRDETKHRPRYYFRAPS